MKHRIKLLSTITTGLFLLSISKIAQATSIITDPLGGPVKDKQAISDLISRLTNIVVGAAGIIAVAMIVWGGVLYLTSGGNEERRGKGRQTLTWAIAGLIVTICSYAIIYVFTKMLGGNIP